MMILLEAPVTNWSEWIFNQLGVAVGAIAVCIFLYKLYEKSLASKDRIITQERDRLLEELDEAQAEANAKDVVILDLQKQHHVQLQTLHDNYQELFREVQKEQNEVALKTVEALAQTSNLIEGSILNKMDMQGQKIKEAINLMRSEIVGKIDGLNIK